MEEEFKLLSPEDVEELIEAGGEFKLVDVRTEEEYEVRHIPGAILLPLGSFAGSYASLLNESDEVILYCEHGQRSERAARFLVGQGFSNVSHMYGGLSEYTGATEP